MVRAEIIEEVPIGMSELKSELKRIKKRDEESSPRLQKLEEYLNNFNQISKADYDSMVSEISQLNVPRLKDVHVMKIADIMPENVEELKSILQGYAITITAENMKKIITVTKKFAH